VFHSTCAFCWLIKDNFLLLFRRHVNIPYGTSVVNNQEMDVMVRNLALLEKAETRKKNMAFL